VLAQFGDSRGGPDVARAAALSSLPRVSVRVRVRVRVRMRVREG